MKKKKQFKNESLKDYRYPLITIRYTSTTISFNIWNLKKASANSVHAKISISTFIGWI